MYTIEQFCIDNKLSYRKISNNKFMQYIISDGNEKSILNVYHTGTLLVQGKENNLKIKLLSFVNGESESLNNSDMFVF